MDASGIALLFGGVLFLIVGALHQMLRPKETRYSGFIWFLRLWEIRPSWCYLLGLALIVAGIARALVT